MIKTIEEFRASRVETADAFTYADECTIGRDDNLLSLTIGNAQWCGIASPEYLARLESILYLTHYMPENGVILSGDTLDSYVRDVCEALDYECDGDAFGMAFASVDYPISAGEALSIIYDTVRTYKLSRAARHAAWEMETRKAWLATENGKTLAALGFDLQHTGGGCTALDSEPENGWYIRVTDSDGMGHTLDGDSDHWLVGAHHVDGDMYSSECAEARTFTELLDAINVHRLALRFAAFVRHDIGETKFPEMRDTNARIYGDKGDVCATHDYCDANMPMLAAFRDVLKRDPDVADEYDSSVWNRAWDIAKRDYLSDGTNDVAAIAYDEIDDESTWPVETVTESPVEIFSDKTVDVYKGHGLYERKSIQTFKVTFPATITLEIEGVDAKSVTQVLFDAFSPSRGNDPLEGVTITISHGTPFSVSNVATIKTAVIEELADIDVESV